MKRFFSLFLCISALVCYAADSVDTILFLSTIPLILHLTRRNSCGCTPVRQIRTGNAMSLVLNGTHLRKT